MFVCSCHVTYTFQSESTLYSFLNVKELLAWSRCKIWSLSDCNWTWTHSHLICKQTLNHTLLEEHSFNVFCLTETWLNDHEFKTNSNYHLQNYKRIMEEKLTKEGVVFLCILGMTLPIKFETICVFLMAIEKFSQLNYL